MEGARAAAERAAGSGHRHQAAVAQLTGDNLVLVLRAKAAEEEVAALKKEREELRAVVDEQRGPWFDEVGIGVLGVQTPLIDRLILIPIQAWFVHIKSQVLRQIMCAMGAMRWRLDHAMARWTIHLMLRIQRAVRSGAGGSAPEGRGSAGTGGVAGSENRQQAS